MKLTTSKKLSKLFHFIAIAWSIIVVLLVLISIIGMFLSEPSFYFGWKRVMETFSPFNVANFIVIVILLLPAVGAFKITEYFEKKAGLDKKI